MHCDVRIFLPMRLYALVTVALVVLSKCLRSSVHKRLYICLVVETLVVLFKCLEPSVHMCLCMFLHVFKD